MKGSVIHPQWQEAPTIWLDRFPRPCSLGVYITLSPLRQGRLPVFCPDTGYCRYRPELQKPSGETSAAEVKGKRSISSLTGISYYFRAFEITCSWCSDLKDQQEDSERPQTTQLPDPGMRNLNQRRPIISSQWPQGPFLSGLTPIAGKENTLTTASLCFVTLLQKSTSFKDLLVHTLPFMQ